MPSSGLGDQIAVTPSIRSLRKRHPKEILLLEGFGNPEIFELNPYVPGGDSESGEVIRLSNDTHMDVPCLPWKFARQIGVDLVDETPEIFLSTEERAFDFGIRDWSRSIAIDTFAHNKQRRWPMENFQVLVRQLVEAGWLVIEVGRHPWTPKLQGAVDLRDRFTVRQTAAALAMVTVYMGNDSGLFHLAAAVGTPQVALFSISPARRRAYKTTTALEAIIPCRGWDCAAGCKQGPEPRCLLDISPDQVLEAVERAATSPRSCRS